MFQALLYTFFILLFSFVGVYVSYFTYLKISTKKLWNLNSDKNFQPSVSILVPAHNEENIIESKLRNIEDVSYPKEKIEVIVVDDASEDNTLSKIANFIKSGNKLNVKVFKQVEHKGKAVALNSALSVTSNDIVIVSDADTEWPADILQRTMPYMADKKVGAITCAGFNKNQVQSWVTKGEDTYLNFAHFLRLGESKIHSTIRFEGGFCAYRKGAFEQFDSETGADDSGTALEVIQHGYRAILVPDSVFYTSFSASLQSKFKTKTRRATQLMGLWSKSLKLFVHGKLLLPKRIAIPEILLFFLMPSLFLLLIGVTTLLLLLQPLFSVFSISIVILLVGLLVFARHVFIELVIDNLILLYALMRFLFGRRYIAWERN